MNEDTRKALQWASMGAEMRSQAIAAIDAALSAPAAPVAQPAAPRAMLTTAGIIDVARSCYIDITDDTEESVQAFGVAVMVACAEAWGVKVNGITKAPAPAAPVAKGEPVAPMSQPNRLVAYLACDKLRNLGYKWDEKAKAWSPAAPVAQGKPVGRLLSDPDDGHVFVPSIPDDWSMLGKDLYTTPAAPVAHGHRIPADMRAAFDVIEVEVASGRLDAMATFTRMRTIVQGLMPAPVAPVALTDERIAALHSVIRSGHHPSRDFVAGVRAAERAHGITKGEA